jgi:CTP:phosphocholine cytidylyltransferase-like protein
VYENLHSFFNNAIYIDAFTDLILVKNIEQEFLDNKLYSGFFKSAITSEFLQIGTKTVYVIPMVIGMAANVTLPDYATEKANIINDYDL